jgi:hypothetical protein
MVTGNKNGQFWALMDVTHTFLIITVIQRWLGGSLLYHLIKFEAALFADVSFLCFSVLYSQDNGGQKKPECKFKWPLSSYHQVTG